MKKRILSAALALIMLISAFALAGCGEEETDPEADTGQRVSTTLTMWLPAAKGTSVDDESVAQVERAVNNITQSAYSTAIKLKVIPYDEYDSAVNEKLSDIKTKSEKEEAEAAERRKAAREAAARGEKYVEDTAAAEEENNIRVNDEYENEFSAMNAAIFASYPAVESTQFDIFVIHGYNEYKALCDNFLLAELDENLKDESKILSDYIYPTFFSAVKYQGSTYAVPNNHAIGTYKFMLVNKKIAEDLYYDPAEFNSVAKLFTYDNSGISFIEDVAANYPEVTPVVGTYNVPYIKYWNSTDNSDFSLLSSLMSPGAAYTDVEIQNTFKNTNFVNGIYYSKRINEITTPAPVGSTDNFAVAFLEGSAEDMEKYSDEYQVTVIENPVPTDDDIFGSMFAVSSYSQSVDRSMEIITLLNTNTELRTILQYGVEGTHWKKDVDDESIMHVISDKYTMDIRDTGNEYMTYPGDGIPMDYWKYSKTQNIASYLPLSNGFTYINEQTSGVLDELQEKSDEIWARISAMSAAEFNSSTAALRDEVDALDVMKKLTYNPDVKEDPSLKYEESIVYYWNEYLKELGDQ